MNSSPEDGSPNNYNDVRRPGLKRNNYHLVVQKQ